MKVFTIILLLISNPAFGQTDRKPLFKFGGFFYFIHSKYNGFSTHLEYETTFSRNEFLTFGPRLDYTKFKSSYGALLVGYELKLYPFYWISKNAYQGIFIGFNPVYLVKNQEIYDSRFGPGIGSLVGYQHLFKKKISACLEGSMIYLQDLSKYAVQHNPEHRYLYVFACIKMGIKL